MRVLKSTLGFSLLGLILTGPVQAATTVSGTVNASLVLTSSCLINGVVGAGGAVFGALDFGTTTTLFDTANAQVMSGAGALKVLCSARTTPAITLGTGAHDGLAAAQGTRALANGSNYVGYDLYSDSGHTTLVAIGGNVTLPLSTGVEQTVNIYGKATGKSGLPAGTYSDTITVVLTF